MFPYSQNYCFWTDSNWMSSISFLFFAHFCSFWMSVFQWMILMPYLISVLPPMVQIRPYLLAHGTNLPPFLEVRVWGLYIGLTLTSFVAPLLGMTYIPCWSLQSVDAIYPFVRVSHQILWENITTSWGVTTRVSINRSKVGPLHVVHEKAKRHKSFRMGIS